MDSKREISSSPRLLGEVLVRRPDGTRIARRSGRSTWKILGGRDFRVALTGDAEAVEDGARGVGAVEGVEMDSGDVVVEQVVALFEREVNADTLDHLFVGLTTLERTQ